MGSKKLVKGLKCPNCAGKILGDDLKNMACRYCGEAIVLTKEAIESIKETRRLMEYTTFNIDEGASAVLEKRTSAIDAKVNKLDKKYERVTTRYKKRINRKFNPMKTVTWLLVLAGAYGAYYYSSTQIFAGDTLGIDFNEQWEWIALFAVGLLFFIIATVQVGGTGVGGVASLFSRLAKRRIGPMTRYIPKAVHANTRRIKNMIGSMILGTSLVVSLIVLHDTVMRGNDSANRTYLGGDVVVYDPMLHVSELDSLANVEGVAGVATYMYFSMDGWKFNTRSDIVGYLVNTADNYGGKTNNITENLNVVIIDPDEYKAMNPELPVIHNEFYDPPGTVYDITAPNAFESPGAFIDRLKQPRSVIVQDRLLETLGKSVEDTITLNLNGFETDLEIVGAASSLPAVPYMKFMDTPEWFLSHRSLVISRDTFSTMLSDFIGDVDIVMKNMSVYDEFAQYSNDTFPEDIAGYTSGRMIEATRNAITPLINAVPGVKQVAYRFSSFAPGFPNINATYDPSRVVYLQPNVTINQSGMVELPNRLYLVDSTDEAVMTGNQDQIVECHDWINSATYTDPLFEGFNVAHNRTVREVMYTIDNFINSGDRSTYFNNNTLCVMNKYVTMYEDINNMTWVYEMKVGDVLSIELPKDNVTSEIFNLTVAATIDNHLAYLHQNGTEREGYKLSSKSLNYDFNADYSSPRKSTFYDAFDADANVIYASFDELLWSYPFTPQEFDDLRNHAYITVQDGYDASEVADNIATAINAVALNYSVFPYKSTFLDRAVNMGVVAVSMDEGYTDWQVIENLEEWYIAHNYTWKLGSVGSLSRFRSDIPIVNPIFRVFLVVAIFSLLASAIGLCTIVYANIKKRSREFGIYKAIGYKNKTIKDVIFFETFIVTFLGVALGIVSGLAMIWVMYEAVSAAALIPMAFSIPIWTVISVVVLLTAVTMLSSNAIANRVQKLSISENIRYRE